MKKAQGITEELKAKDMMAWVGAVTNIKACAEEIINEELIYAQKNAKKRAQDLIIGICV